MWHTKKNVEMENYLPKWGLQNLSRTYIYAYLCEEYKTEREAWRANISDREAREENVFAKRADFFIGVYQNYKSIYFHQVWKKHEKFGLNNQKRM